MPFAKGQSGNPAGRRKGAANKTTRQAKEAIALVFDGLGGVEAMLTWAKASDENKRVFYSSIYPKLVPLEVQGTHHVETVDRTQLLREAEDEVRRVFGDRAGEGAAAYGGGLPH